jgi:hypothetical protein
MYFPYLKDNKINAMGRLLSGIGGPIQGKVGKVIGSSRNGVPYIKGLYKNRTLKVSEKEKANRIKFAAAQAWLKPILDFVREGFRGYSQRSQGFIAAKSWLLKNAFVKDGENMRIDPARVKVSSGSLRNPSHIEVSLTETGNLKFTWDTADDVSGNSDQIMVLAYDVEKKYAPFKSKGQFRSAGVDYLQLERTRGNHFHVYAAFVAADRSRQSESIYLGEWKI